MTFGVSVLPSHGMSRFSHGGYVRPGAGLRRNRKQEESGARDDEDREAADQDDRGCRRPPDAAARSNRVGTRLDPLDADPPITRASTLERHEEATGRLGITGRV